MYRIIYSHGIQGTKLKSQMAKLYRQKRRRGIIQIYVYIFIPTYIYIFVPYISKQLRDGTCFVRYGSLFGTQNRSASLISQGLMIGADIIFLAFISIQSERIQPQLWPFG